MPDQTTAVPLPEPVAWRMKELVNGDFVTGWHLLSAEPPTSPRTVAIEPLFTSAQLLAYGDRRAAEERERIAELVEGNHIVSGGNGPNFCAGWEMALEACADAIRKGA